MAFGLPEKEQKNVPLGTPTNGGYGTNTGNVFMNKGWKDYVKGTGFDPNGNNEIGQLFRRGAFGLAPDFLNRIGFMNEIGPLRLDAIRQFMARFAPGNLQNTADQNRARLLRQGSQSAAMARARVKGFGGSQDAQIGASLARMNQANDAANQYQNDLYSPEGQNAIFQGQMQGMNQAQDLNMQNLMAMFQAAEQRYRQNQADQQQGGIGGLMGQIGQIAGMAAPFMGVPSMSPLQRGVQNGSLTPPDASNPFYR